MWDPQLDPETEKKKEDIKRKTGEILIRSII